MKLADDITIMIDGERVNLVPRLRHAIRLERRPGSFASLMREVAEESLSAACEIIGDHVEITPGMQDAILRDLPRLKYPLVAYVGALTGIDEDDIPAEGEKPKGKPVTIAEHLTALYKLGTVYFNWSPAQTLDSTPAEIRITHIGRLEAEKAFFGGGEKSQPGTSDTPATPDQLTAKMKFIFGARAKAKKAEA